MYYSTIIVLFCVSKCPIATRPCMANALFLGTHRVSFYKNKDNQMISDSKHKIKPFETEYSWKIMELNLPMEGRSEQATSSDDGQSQFTVAFRKMVKKEVEMMKKEVVEDLLRKIEKDGIQSAQAEFLTGGNRSLENETMVSKERSLGLKFLDEVFLPVLTGEVINGKGGTPLRVALVDKLTEQVIDCGPGSSSKVEILILEANDDDNDWSPENSNNRIIREGDKNKPHFAKSNYINLKDGIGTLCKTKLGHDSTWMKNCQCRLGARMESFGGKKVQEAWTESFTVSDKRSKLYGKHDHPSLFDHVWRLKQIGKNGPRFQRLKEKKILTVRDFLFWHYTDPEALQKIVGGGAKIWKATIEHAQTCVIDDQRMYVYYPMSQSKTGVVFDVVGRLKGAIHGSHYVPNSNLSEAEKADAEKLLESAHKDWEKVEPFNDEESLQQYFNGLDCPVANHENAQTSEMIGESSSRSNFSLSEMNSISEMIGESSSRSNFSAINSINETGDISSFGTDDVEIMHDASLLQLSTSASFNFNNLFPDFDDYLNQKDNAKPQKRWSQLFYVLKWFSIRKKVMALEGIHVQKRQRT